MPCMISTEDRLRIVRIAPDVAHWTTPATYIAAFEALEEAERGGSVHAALLVFERGMSGALAADPDIDRSDLTRISARLHYPRSAGEPSAWTLLERAFGRRLSLPVVAAIEGDCLDAGLAFVALHADIRIAAAQARFGFPGLTSADAAGFVVASALDRQIATVALNELVERGEAVSARWALHCHLVTECVDRSDVVKRASEAARQLTGLPRHVTRAQKAWLDAALRVEESEMAILIALGGRP